MNKGELIDKIAKDAKISKVQASNALNSSIDGVVSSRLLAPDAALSTPLPTEDPQGRNLDPILLIDASSEPAAATAGRQAAQRIGAGSDDLSFLRLMWQLRHTDLQRQNGGA